jgi:REP element-mobilizing transposase RayT
MVRGIERRLLFVDDADREELLRRLSLLLSELGFLCFAWALMPNHVHLVLRSGRASISRLMARLGTGYAVYFNKRHERVGHLFQNRFRSRRVLDEGDLLGLVVYVIRNPAEAGLVDPAASAGFPWCGLGALLGVRPPHPFESVSETLALFDRDPVRARACIRSWFGSADINNAFDREILPRASLTTEPTRFAGLEELQQEICRGFGVSPTALRSRQRGRTLVAARSALVRTAVVELGASGAEVARWLGLSRAAVSLMLGRERSRGPSDT